MYYSALDVLLSLSNGKGFKHLPFDVEPLIWTCLDMHSMAKYISNVRYDAKATKNEALLKICDEVDEKLDECYKDLNKIVGQFNDQNKFLNTMSKATETEIRTKEDLQKFNQEMMNRLNIIKQVTEVIDVEKGASAGLLPIHTMEKLSAQLEYNAQQEGLKNVEDLAKRLSTALEDVHTILYSKAGSKNLTDAILKKYAHNIPSVIKNNDMILTLKNGIEDKNLLGNKGANLVTMHKLGINVPQTLFLTTKLCKAIRDTGSLDFFPILKQLLYMFPEDKIAVRSSGVVSMAGMMDTVLDIDKTDDRAVQQAILGVIQSWDSDKAKKYRKICKIDDEIQLAIVIQPVIRGDKGYSGVCFSRDVSNGNPKLVGEYLKNQLGDALVSGETTPQRIENGLGKFPARIYFDLAKAAQTLEIHFKAVQDIEFVNDGKETYIVQTRNAKLSAVAAVKTLIDFYNEGTITKEEFKKKFNPRLLDECKEFKVLDSQGFLFRATGAVNGVVSGKVTFNKSTANEDNILITDITTPEDLGVIHKVKGLITRIGGFTSHPAVICRQMKKPCIIGAEKLHINEENGIAFWGKKEIHRGDVITIIGNTGEVWLGEAKVEMITKYEKEVNEILNSERQ